MYRPHAPSPARHWISVRIAFAFGIAALMAAGLAPAASANLPFGARTVLNGGTFTFKVALGDLDGDGVPEIAETNYSANTVSVFRPFYPNYLRSDLPVGNGPTGVAIADVTGDGKLDVLVVNQTDNTLMVFPGTGFGTFLPVVTYATGTGPWAIAVGDLNQDGRNDVVVTNFSGTISVFLANGSGGLSARVDYATGAGPEGVAVGRL